MRFKSGEALSLTLSLSAMLVSGRDIISSTVPSKQRNLINPTRILSKTDPTGFVKERIPSTGCLNGSATCVT
jgi:hypothetical protein